jgi:hypothetical protein
MVKTRYDKKIIRDALIKNDYSIKQTAIDIKEKAANLRMYISRNKDYMYEFKEKDKKKIKKRIQSEMDEKYKKSFDNNNNNRKYIENDIDLIRKSKLLSKEEFDYIENNGNDDIIASINHQINLSAVLITREMDYMYDELSIDDDYCYQVKKELSEIPQIKKIFDDRSKKEELIKSTRKELIISTINETHEDMKTKRDKYLKTIKEFKKDIADLLKLKSAIIAEHARIDESKKRIELMDAEIKLKNKEIEREGIESDDGGAAKVIVTVPANRRNYLDLENDIIDESNNE